MLSTPIAPKHIFMPAVKKGNTYFDSFLSTNTKPKDFVVSGAFKLKEYVPAQRVVFERNPNYYEINTKQQKLPYLDKLVYLIVGDLNNEVLKFEAKELDVIFFVNFLSKFTSFGKISDSFGTNKTSSKVKASLIFIKYPFKV